MRQDFLVTATTCSFCPACFSEQEKTELRDLSTCWAEDLLEKSRQQWSKTPCVQVVCPIPVNAISQ